MTNNEYGKDISIVIPCYNRETLIRHSIDSAIENGEGAEIIVIDDGSTDLSWKVIQSYGNKIRKYQTKNSGVSATRNFGIGKSDRLYIKFLDSDDVLPPGAIVALDDARKIVGHNVIVFGDAVSIDEAGARISSYGYGYSEVAEPGIVSIPKLLSATMSPLLPLFPTRLLRQFGGFDVSYSLGEDQELMLRMALGGAAFVRIPCVVAEVREHDEYRLSRSNPELLYAKHVFMYEGLIEHVNKSMHSNRDCLKALSKQIIISARDAARCGVHDPAAKLFRLALGWPGIDPTPSRLKLAYKTLGPYRTEQWLNAVKGVRDTLKKAVLKKDVL